ncbi:TPA: hypothetical protein ACH3X1_005226 [Trebouxia sp. C0004]
MLIKRYSESKRPKAQGAATFMWALATLGHADQSMIDDVCDHFATLIKHSDESKRPNAGGAAQFVWAVATVGHEPADEGLADAVCEHYAMFTKHSAREAANVIELLGQLYQALDSLQPLPTAAEKQMQEMVTRFGPRPLPKERSATDLSASKHLWVALGQLGLAFTPNVPLSGYWADTLLQPQHDGTAPVVLLTEGRDHLRKKTRGFRQTLLAKHGKLILVPKHELSRNSVPDLAAYLQQGLQAVAGDSLVAYRS